MKKTGEYGEFFPPAIAPVCYNETQGNYYIPLTKEEVLDRGWLWEDKVPGIFGKENIKTEAFPIPSKMLAMKFLKWYSNVLIAPRIIILLRMNLFFIKKKKFLCPGVVRIADIKNDLPFVYLASSGHEPACVIKKIIFTE